MSGTDTSVPPPKRFRKLRWVVWLLIGVVGGAAVYGTERPIYRASTEVMIVPQRVPERMVPSTVTASLAERLDIIGKQILSRTRLERIVQELNLYEAERREMIMEDVIERMRGDIRLSVTYQAEAERAASFRESFDSNDPRIAKRVTNASARPSSSKTSEIAKRSRT